MKVLTSDWNSSKAQLMFVRKQVFGIEQGIAAEDDFDHQDASAVHFVSFGTTAVPTGVCRLTEQGQIGRLSVLPNYRSQGYGKMLLRKAIEVAREMGFKEVFLHAQVEVQVYYEHFGFKTDGKIFFEAGKPHVNMIREI
ncbi:GNAT family N-acetyltransferase [Maribrevibacterium harenarium]|uniref:GNAT family N-acetyltransferase n=2 Tax=Maribrevibacterium harenarium TaxID=2589817 RepID=A0A501WLT8_9GAMM|nr:GNAT family N-acetyltransferase [Maribrevibacterium harenarium]